MWPARPPMRRSAASTNTTTPARVALSDARRRFARRSRGTRAAGGSPRSGSASRRLEVVLQAGGPEHVRPQSAPVQGPERVRDERDAAVRHELEAERPVDHIITFGGNVRRLDSATERQVVGDGARQPQLALTNLELRHQV